MKQPISVSIKPEAAAQFPSIIRSINPNSFPIATSETPSVIKRSSDTSAKFPDFLRDWTGRLHTRVICMRCVSIDSTDTSLSAKLQSQTEMGISSKEQRKFIEIVKFAKSFAEVIKRTGKTPMSVRKLAMKLGVTIPGPGQQLSKRQIEE